MHKRPFKQGFSSYRRMRVLLLRNGIAEHETMAIGKHNDHSGSFLSMFQYAYGVYWAYQLLGNEAVNSNRQSITRNLGFLCRITYLYANEPIIFLVLDATDKAPSTYQVQYVIRSWVTIRYNQPIFHTLVI